MTRSILTSPFSRKVLALMAGLGLFGSLAFAATRPGAKGGLTCCCPPEIAGGPSCCCK